MNYINKKILILIILILIRSGLHADEFLNMFTPAETIGLGDSFAANSIGANSVWLNPAGLSKCFANQYSIGGARWINNVNLIIGSAVIPMNIGNFGVGVGWLGMASENYENEIGETTGDKLNFNNLLVNIGYSREFYYIPIGINLKFVKSSLGLSKYDELLILSDIGAMYSIWKLNFGLMLRNFGISSYEPGNWGELRTGVKWNVFSQRSVGLKVLSDYFYSAIYGMGITFGTELELFRAADIRAGYSPMAFNKLQFGVGFKFNLSQWHLKLDYGMNPALEGLDMSHFIQITVHSRTKELKQKTRAFAKKAEDYMESEDFTRAEKEVERALLITPDDKELIGLKNKIMTRKNQKKAEPHFNSAVKFIRIKNYKKAEKELIIVIKLTPNNKEAHCSLGKVYYEQGNYRSAMEYFQNALGLDKDYEEAKKMETKILAMIEKQKPKWIKEDKYYTKARLVFDDFQEDAILPKFVTDDGEFTIEKDGEIGYASWQIADTTNRKVLITAIRLPNLSKFKGILVSFKSDDIKKMDIILVEQSIKGQNEWWLPISNIEDDWKDIKIPFHYFQLPGKAGVNIDLGKITQIKFVVDKKLDGTIDIDNIEFYQ